MYVNDFRAARPGPLLSILYQIYSFPGGQLFVAPRKALRYSSTLSLPNLTKSKFRNFTFWNFEKQIASCESTGKELSFEWSHHRISSTDSKVRVPLKSPSSMPAVKGLKHSLRWYGLRENKAHVACDFFFFTSVFTISAHYNFWAWNRLDQGPVYMAVGDPR